MDTTNIANSGDETERLYREIFEDLPYGVICQNPQGDIILTNPIVLQLFDSENLEGITNTWGEGLLSLNGTPLTHSHPARIAQKTQQPTHTDICVRMGSGTLKHFKVEAKPFRITQNSPPHILSSITPLPDSTTTDSEKEANLFRFSAIEKINKISLESGSMESMLEKTLHELLVIFNCDRAIFFYPCDPDEKTVFIVKDTKNITQKTGQSPQEEFPIDKGMATILRHCSDADEPLCSNGSMLIPQPKEEEKSYPVSAQMMKGFKVKSGAPWGLIVQYYNHPRHFNSEEKLLFIELVRRIGISISSFMTLQNLKESEERFRLLVENAPDALFVLDPETKKFVDVNKNTCELFQMRRNELFEADHTQFSPIYQPEGYPSASTYNNMIKRTLQGEQPVFEWTYLNASGERIPCETRLLKLPGQDRPLIRGSIINISERLRNEAQMRKLSRALQQTADAIIITDKYGVIEYVNPAFEKITGYLYSEVAGKTPQILKSHKHDAHYYERMWRMIKNGLVFSDVVTNKRKDGTFYHEEKTITPLKDKRGKITHFISTGRDITERIHTQERLEYLAHHDILTDLPNRNSFTERLTLEIKYAIRNQRRVAVLFVDLDQFKFINDTLGHDVGDSVLRTIANRLVRNLRSSDTVSRLGGDEFAVILANITTGDEAAIIAEKLLHDLAPPILIQGRELFISASIGISTFPDDGAEPRVLIKHADIAMYRAKKLGRNNYQFFSKEMSVKAVERLTMETNLRRALKRNEFCLYYQPQFSLQTRQITGVEALLRWDQPGLGITPPTQFIPILEETGLIVPVGEWVLREACKQLKTWHDDGHKIRMSVNVSSRQFGDDNFESRFSNIISRSKVDPCYLELELTESLLLKKPSKIELILNHLSQKGIGLSIDDFGTGYSSLSYLKRFPLDTLKIDRSFVNTIVTNENDSAIVSTIIAMARTLKMDVIAEGVETEEQLTFLRKHNCDRAQGFLFSKPVPAQDVTALLEQEYGQTAS